jgi:hypothetical protein
VAGTTHFDREIRNASDIARVLLREGHKPDTEFCLKFLTRSAVCSNKRCSREHLSAGAEGQKFRVGGNVCYYIVKLALLITGAVEQRFSHGGHSDDSREYFALMVRLRVMRTAIS